MSDFTSLIFYIVSFFTSFLFYYLFNKSEKKIFLILSFMIPLLMGGLRYNVGTDYGTYVGLYNIYSKYNFIDIIFKSEIDIGFAIIAFISKYIGGVNMMFFIYSFLTLLFAFLGINNLDKKNRSFAYLIYLFLYFTSSFNGMRQMLAANIVFYSFKYIINKNFWKYLLFILLAGINHATAFLCLPLYFICNLNNKYVKILILIIFGILCLNYTNILNLITKVPIFSKYSVYDSYTAGYSFNNYNFYLSLIILAYISIFYKKLYKLFNGTDIYYLVFVIGVILNFTGFISPDVKRISAYFKIPEVALLSQIPNCNTLQKNKLLHYLLILIYTVGSFAVSSYILKQSNTIPYKWIG